MLKAEVISVDDLSPLGWRPFHVHKVMQVQTVNEGLLLLLLSFLFSCLFLFFAGVR